MDSLQCRHFLWVHECFCSQKRHVETPEREEEIGRVKGSGERVGREKKKRLPQNTMKMRNTPWAFIIFSP